MVGVGVKAGRGSSKESRPAAVRTEFSGRRVLSRAGGVRIKLLCRIGGVASKLPYPASPSDGSGALRAAIATGPTGFLLGCKGVLRCDCPGCDLVSAPVAAEPFREVSTAPLALNEAPFGRGRKGEVVNMLLPREREGAVFGVGGLAAWTASIAFEMALIFFLPFL